KSSKSRSQNLTETPNLEKSLIGFRKIFNAKSQSRRGKANSEFLINTDPLGIVFRSGLTPRAFCA
ncbi:MAG TPA: hypothetical protein VJ904_01440, partial [Tichowtungia sp.]|nr:hypothetical protein [Tichowtungia sp.]